MQLKYRCAHCHEYGIRLWRDYGMFLRLDDLLCTKCTEFEQGRKYKSSNDQIGWRVPFCPTPNGNAWGFTSVPDEDCRKWYELPI